MKPKHRVPNSLKQKFSYAKTMASYVNRLSINNQINEAQNALLQLFPVWQEWCRNQSKNSETLLSNSKLKSFEQGVLQINCNNASCSTLIKHRSNELIDAFHQRGFKQLKRINVGIELPTQNNSSFLKNHQAASNSGIESNRPKPDNKAIKAVESASRSTQSSDLSNSLQKLATTLRRNSR